MLIKIDAEGFESEVIKGSKKTLSAKTPDIIFEATDAGRREELFDLLHSLRYGVAALPWVNEILQIRSPSRRFWNILSEIFWRFQLMPIEPFAEVSKNSSTC